MFFLQLIPASKCSNHLTDFLRIASVLHDWLRLTNFKSKTDEFPKGFMNTFSDFKNRALFQKFPVITPE